MKNLSLQMTEATSLKKSADLSNKSNVGTYRATNVESDASQRNASFQMVLNKQVHDQKETAKKTTEKENEPVDTKSEPVDVSATQKNLQKARHLQSVMVITKLTKAMNDAEMIDTTKMPAKEVELEVKSNSLNKGEELLKPEESLAIAIDGNLTAAPVLDAILPSAMLNHQQLTPSMVNPNQAPSEYQRNLGAGIGAEVRDVMLNSKIVKSDNSIANNPQEISADEAKQTINNRFEAMLPNTPTKQMNSEELIDLKSNPIKETHKELLIKEISMPTIAQASTQSNATEAMKQVGSSNMINAYPGKTGWDQAISQKVVWMLGANEQSATLTLNPPELGPLKVVINVHNDQANTTFISDNAEVRQALQDGMDNLRSKLNESGIMLGQANVSSGGQMQQQFQQTAQQHSKSWQNGEITPQTETKLNAQRIVKVANGLVDTFV